MLAPAWPLGPGGLRALPGPGGPDRRYGGVARRTDRLEQEAVDHESPQAISGDGVAARAATGKSCHREVEDGRRGRRRLRAFGQGALMGGFPLGYVGLGGGSLYGEVSRDVVVVAAA